MAAFTLSCLGYAGRAGGTPLSWMPTPAGDELVDQAARNALGGPGRPWAPMHSDERHYNLARIPTVLISSAFDQYPEYHTSADTLDLVTEESAQRAVDGVLKVLRTFDQGARRFRWPHSHLPHPGEPRLSAHGLRNGVGGPPSKNPSEHRRAIAWVLHEAVRGSTILEISQRSWLSVELLAAAAEELLEAGLIQEPVAP